MIFGTDYRKSPETVANNDAGPVSFNRGMPKYAVALFMFAITGTNAAKFTLAGSLLTKYQLYLDTELVIDMTPSETRALFEYIFSRMGGQVQATSAASWAWPFYLLGLLAPMIDNGNYPEVGLPAGSDKVWQTVFTADPASVASLKIGWKKSSKRVTHTPLMIGRVLSGMTATTKDNLYECNWQLAPVVGIIINGLGHFDRMRIFAADAGGQPMQVCDVTTADFLLDLLDPYNVQSITDPFFIPFDVPTIMAKGSYILFDTNGSYTGAERIVPVQLVPEAAPAK
jgi:hypothetical protein